MKNKSIWTGIICVIICEFLFGFSFVFTKTVTAEIAALDLLSWRFMLALLVLCACKLLGIIKVDFKKASIKPLILIAAFHPVTYFIGETVGISRTTASESGIMIAWIPVATLVLAAFILKERPRKNQIFGISITLCGVVFIVIMQGIEASLNPLGYIMLTMAVIAYALYSIFSQRTTHFTDMEKTFVMIASGATVFTTGAVVRNLIAGTLDVFVMLPFSNSNFAIAILYLGIGSSVLAFFLYNKAISHLGTSKTASFAGMTTVVTIISGVTILGEKITIWQALGTVVILGGVYLANMEPKAPVETNIKKL